MKGYAYSEHAEHVELDSTMKSAMTNTRSVEHHEHAERNKSGEHRGVHLGEHHERAEHCGHYDGLCARRARRVWGVPHECIMVRTVSRQGTTSLGSISMSAGESKSGKRHEEHPQEYRVLAGHSRGARGVRRALHV